ncbi:DUF5018 domain-containing protein, partial [Natronoflexus pectinivorans]
MTFFSHKIQILFPLILMIFVSGLEAQQRSDITSKKTSSQTPAPLSTQDAAQSLQTDFNIDVQFYHISIDIDINNKTIDGSVVVDFKSLINNLNQIKLNLRNVFTVTNITMDGAPVTWSHSNHILNINLNQTYSIGDEPSVKIYYNGAPERVQSGGITKGFRFDTYGNNDVPAIVNLSTPYLSHYWFPCKDGPTDKADNGVRLDITVPNTTYGGRNLKAVSNGVLINEVVNNGKRTYTWQHNHAIAPYYILVAVSNYQTIERTYNKNGHNFPIKYYTFPNNSSQATSIADMFDQAFDAYIHYFGDYPYRDEGYAMTEIVPFWYIEKQTNSVVANWNWTILMPHELAHMWFGNSITNQTWQHIWLNEGFATYAEALYYEYTSGIGVYHDHMRSMGSRLNWERRLFLEDDSKHWEVFDYFYYEKGAWLLHMLRGYIGDDEIFFDLIKSYAQDPQFKHGYITTDEFRQYVEAFTGLDLYNFFDQWVYDMSFADYEYNFYSDLSQGKAGLTINQSQSEGISNEREIFEMNLDVRLEFADGTSRMERVYNNQKLQHFYFDIDKEVIDIIIDPDEWVIRFDIKYDSSLPVPPAPIAENRILSFSVEEQIGETQINHTTGTIQFAVSENENINALAPQIDVSPGAIVSPASGETQDFSSPIVYTVIASDNSVKEYTVTVVTLSSDSQITSFTIVDQIGETVIDDESETISITMPFGTDLTNLTPVIEFSENATVDPQSGVAQDFSDPFAYTVTAEDETTKTYLVTVTNAMNSEAKIIEFSIDQQIGETSIHHEDGTVSITMPFGTDLTSLTPVIELSENASIDPESGVAQDFSDPFAYTVTAEDETTKTYLVTVTNAMNSEAKIIEFSIDQQIGETSIHHEDGTVSVTMPFGTDLTSLTPVIELSENASIDPESGVAQDFSDPFAYTVTAEDETTKTYLVTVTNAMNSEAKIIEFSIDQQIGETSIHHEDGTVSITMPFGTDLTNLSPVIEFSENATVDPQSGVAQNFSDPVEYTVTAEDGTTSKEYLVTVTLAPNNEALITSFSISGQTGLIDDDAGTISITLPFGTDLTNLIPVIELSENATIDPQSGVAQNFSVPVGYTVTAEDETTSKEYLVTVTLAPNNEALITSFSISGQTGLIDDDAGTISITMPFGTDLTSLSPVIEFSENATVDPQSGVAQNFSDPLTYTVTAEDETTSKEYLVTVTLAPNNEALITSFSISGQTGVIDNDAGTISITMPFGTDLTSLTPVIELSENASIDPESGVAQNFSDPLTYTVTAEDETTSKEYLVTVTLAPNNEALITSFSISGQTGLIDDDAGTISITLPFGTDLTSLSPVIEFSENATVDPQSGVAQNFSDPVTYTVTAEDGTTSKEYLVTVTLAPNNEALITSFSISGQTGLIDDDAGTISITLPFGTDLTNLIPVIELSENATIDPQSGVAQNFSVPVGYTVTAEDETTSKEYLVTVTLAPNNEALITSFSISGQTGVIDDDAGTISITMPFGTDLTSLTPVIEFSENASIDPQSGVAQNFSDPLTYTVTAEDGEIFKEYLVTVNMAPNNEALISSFSISEQTGLIDDDAGTISITMPFGTDLTSLTPVIEFSENATVDPQSGVAQNFSDPVTYTVKAEDEETTKIYEVTISVEPNNEALITSFSISGQTGVIDDENETISIIMPFGTDLTNLTPVIEFSENATVDPQSGVAQNFSGPVEYTVTAEDETTSKEYLVTVNVAPNNEALITSFSISGQTGLIDDDAGTISITLP